MNQFNAAAINISVITLPAANQINQNVKSDSNAFNELISFMASSDSTADKAETALFVNSNPAVKAALYQAVTALHISGETARAASSDKQLLEANPLIRQAAAANNLTDAEKEALIKAVKFTAEIITAKASEFNVVQVKPAFAPELTGLQSAAIKQPVNAGAEVKNVLQAAVQNTETAVKIPVSLDSPAAKITVVNPVQAETAAVVNAVPVNPAEPAIAKASVVSIEVPAQIISDPSQVKTAAAESVPVERLVMDLKEAIKSFIDVRLGLIKEEGTAADKSKAEIKAAAEIVYSKIEDLKAVINDDKKAAEAAKIVSEIISGLAGLFAAVEGAGYAAANITPATAVKPLVSTPVTGAGLKEISDSIKRIEVSLSDYNGSSSKEAVVKEAQSGLKDVIARIFMLLNEMNGRAEVTKTTQYVHAPNASFSMRVTHDGSIIINTAAVKPEIPLQALNNPQSINNVVSQPQVKTEQPQPPAALQLSAAPVVKETAVPINTVINDRPEMQAKNLAAPVQVNSGVPAATPQAVPPVVFTEKSSYYNPETLAKNNAKETAVLFGSIAEELTAIKIKESIQVPVEAKVFQKAADAAGIIKENIVIKQVVQNIQNAVETIRTTEVKMILRPENLGSITVRLEASENVITGKIQASSAEVRDILKAALPELRITLNSLGLNADRLEITLSNNSGGSTFDNKGASENYREWEGGVLKVTEEEIDRLNYAGLNGYLSFLA